MILYRSFRSGVRSPPWLDGTMPARNDRQPSRSSHSMCSAALAKNSSPGGWSPIGSRELAEHPHGKRLWVVRAAATDNADAGVENCQPLAIRRRPDPRAGAPLIRWPAFRRSARFSLSADSYGRTTSFSSSTNLSAELPPYRGDSRWSLGNSNRLKVKALPPSTASISGFHDFLVYVPSAVSPPLCATPRNVSRMSQ